MSVNLEKARFRLCGLYTYWTEHKMGKERKRFLSTEKLCKDTILFYQQKPGFKDYPQDFVMEKVEADIDDFNHIPGRNFRR